MSDSVVIVDPGGTEHEFPEGFDPKKAGLIVSRAYGDAQAAAAQKKAEDLSTFGGQLKSRLGTAASAAGGAIVDALNPMNYWRAEQGNVADLRASQAATRAGDQTLGPEKPKGPPIRDQLASLSDPETGGRAIGNLITMGVAGRVLPKVPEAMATTGEAVTRGGEWMNPATTGKMGGAVGGLAGKLLTSPGMNTGGFEGAYIGKNIGSALGEQVPAATQNLGRLITKTGRALGAPEPVPTTRYTPSSGVTRPLTPEEQPPVDEGSPFAKYTPSSSDTAPPSEPAGPPPPPVVPPPTGTGAPAEPASGVLRTEPWTITRDAPVAGGPSGTGTTPAGPVSGASWEQFIRNVARSAPAETAPAAETAAAAPAATAAEEPVSTAQGSLREQLEASLRKAAETGTAATPTTVYHGSAEMGRRGGYPGELRLDVSPIGQARQPGSNADSMGTWWTTSRADAAHYSQSLGSNGEMIPGTVIEGQVSLQNPRVFNSAEEWQKFADSFRKGGQPANGDAIRAQLEGEGHDGLIIKGGGAGDATPEGGDFHLSFNNRNVSVATPAAEGESTIPSKEQMIPDELSRAQEGGRDSPDRQPGETLEDYRLRTRGRATGELSEEPSIIPSRRAKAIDDTIESMYARNATDQEFRDYLAKSKNHPKNGEIAAKIESKAHSWKRASPLAHVLVGAAAGGAALRQALVGQLQGDQKEQP